MTETPTSKICNKCKKEKPLCDFYPSKDGCKYARRSRCKECNNEASRQWKRSISKEHRRRHYQTQKDKDYFNKRNRKIRLGVLEHYGGVCICCGENRMEFLALDHINNDGAEHKKIHNGMLAKWLRSHGLPEGIQVLCHNCNMSLGFYGFCPHRPEITREVRRTKRS